MNSSKFPIIIFENDFGQYCIKNKYINYEGGNVLSLSLALHKCAKNTSINLWNAYYFDFFSYAYSFLRSFLRNILDASYFRTGYGENLISRRHKLLKLLHKSYLISYNELMDISMTIRLYEFQNYQ